MIFVKSFLIYWIAVLFIYFLGYILNFLLYSFSSDKPYKNIFYRIYNGMILLVAGYALLQTSSKSVFLCFLFLLLIYYLTFKKQISINVNLNAKKQFSLQSNFKQITLIFFISNIYLLFFYFLLFDDFFSDYPTRIVNSDYISYARVSEYLALTGQENVWNVHNLILEDYKGTSTFHFFSEWFVAFWVKITDFQSIYIQEIISYAFFAFLSTIGILAILEYYKASINLVDVVLASITTLFFKCIFIFEFKGISFFTLNAFGMPKLWIIYVVIISTLLQILYQNQLVAVLNLLFLPIFYFTAAAAVFSATTSYSFISFLLAQNKQDKANYLKAILISILSFLLIMLFYYLTSSSIAAFNTEKYPYVKTWINVVGGTCIQVLFLLLPFSVLLLLANVFNYKKFNLMELLLEFKNFIQKHLLLILIIFWGILVWATFHFIIDSVQLFQNVGVVTLNLLILNSIFYFGIKFNNKLVFYGLLITILAINLYQTSLRRANQFYSQEYIENIALLLQKYQPNPIGACLFGKENYYPENHDYYINHKYSVNTNSSVLGSQLKYIANFYNAVCITSMEIPNQEDAFVRSVVEKSCFYLYCKKYNLTDITEAKKRFIEQYKIKYVLASKFADISFLKNQILTIVEDKNTAEKFILLK